MVSLEPIYRPGNCNAAYQLNWSLSIFPGNGFPQPEAWLGALQTATETDGVRILECHFHEPTSIQLLISTLPRVSPSRVVASVKGRLQYLVRDEFPRAFRRNYRIESVGEVNRETIEQYVARQLDRHPPVSPLWRRKLMRLQYEDSSVDLSETRFSSSGQYLNNLHVVLENAEGAHLTDESLLAASRDMIVRSCRAKGHRLSRIGLLSNHLHMAIGCGVMDAPESVVLSLMNNLAFVHAMKPILRSSYYVGTFGNFDRNAIRMTIRANARSSIGPETPKEAMPDMKL